MALGLMLACIGVSLVSSWELIAPLYHWIGWIPPQREGYALLLWVLISALLLLGAARLLDNLMVLTKQGAILCLALCSLLAYKQAESGGVWPAVETLLPLAGLAVLFVAYQDKEAPWLHLPIGCAVGCLVLYTPSALVLLPLILVSQNILRELSARNALAVVHGTVIAILLALPLVFLLHEGAIAEQVRRWGDGAMSYEWAFAEGVDMPRDLPYITLLILGAVATLSFGIDAHKESIRQREQGSVLVLWAGYLLVASLLLGGSGSLYAQMAVFPVSTLIARTLAMMRGRTHRIAQIAVVILVLIQYLLPI